MDAMQKALDTSIDERLALMMKKYGLQEKG
jgi:hypothetical protein